MSENAPRNAVLSFGTERGKRMTEEEAEALLKSQGFHFIRSRIITHRNRPAETVIAQWESADYSRRARLRVTYSI